MTKIAIRIDRGQLVPSRQRDDQFAMKLTPTRSPVTIRPPFGARANAVTARSISPASRTSTGLISTPNDGATDCIAANWPIPAGHGGIPKDRRSRHARRDLLEQLQPFRAHAVFELSEAGRVAARPRQALDEAGADRIGDLHEHDRHGAGRLLQWPDGRAANGQDDVRRERDQFRRVSANCVGIAGAPADSRSAHCGRSVQPNSCSPCRNAAMRACDSGSSAATVMSTPMRRTRSACCARAASGHAAAAPHRQASMMNSRRRMPDTRAPPRNRSAAPSAYHPLASRSLVQT